MGADADLVLMLLSSDWFAGYWRRFGLPEQAQREIQRRSRSAVKRLMDGASRYEYVDFSRERVDRSHADLDSILEVLGSTSRFATAIQALIAAGRSFEGAEAGSTEISYLNARLLDDARDNIGDDLGEPLKRKVVEAVREARVPPLPDSAWKPRSAWDEYLCSLNPEIPTFLADFVDIKLIPELEMQVFRAHLLEVLDPKEVFDLQCWYALEAAELGMPFDIEWHTAGRAGRAGDS